jgi:dolichyl-phosphate-mannose-protein mannosyltransferase
VASRAWSRLDWLALAVVSLSAAVTRLPGLSRPIGFVFDEIFYAQNACLYVLDPTRCGLQQLAERSHPPLGKWIIGAGIKLFGYDEFGWRIMAALAGILTVALLFVLVRRLLAGHVTPAGATAGAFVAAGLLTVDFLHLVSSRVGMLDVILTLFVVATVYFAVLDATRDRSVPLPGGAAGWFNRLCLGRPWRMLTGLSLGAATAVKWSGAYTILLIVPLLIAYEVAASRHDPATPAAPPRPLGEAWRIAWRRELGRSVILLGILPFTLYVATYLGRVPGSAFALPWTEGSFWRGIFDEQVRMARFHHGIARNHPYESPPWSWLLLKRPVAYYFRVDGGSYREILAIGNPLTWWSSAAVLIGLGVAWVRRGASHLGPEAVIIGGALAAYLPWLVITGSRTFVFIWYLLPAIPFLCAAVGLLVARVWPSLTGRLVTAVAGVAVLVSFAFFFPVLTAMPLSPDAWRARIWFTDCGRPNAPTLELPNDVIDKGPPPIGWCWI